VYSEKLRIWTEKLSEICRVSFQNKFEKVVHLGCLLQEICHEARSREHQTNNTEVSLLPFKDAGRKKILVKLSTRLMSLEKESKTKTQRKASLENVARLKDLVTTLENQHSIT
jgi:hypothetical protein